MDEETGYNTFDLRMYDAQLGRFFSPDPMQEFFSPYLAMGNNPVSIVDPTGGATGGGGGYDDGGQQTGGGQGGGGATVGAPSGGSVSYNPMFYTGYGTGPHMGSSSSSSGGGGGTGPSSDHVISSGDYQYLPKIEINSLGQSNVLNGVPTPTVTPTNVQGQTTSTQSNEENNWWGDWWNKPIGIKTEKFKSQQDYNKWKKDNYATNEQAEFAELIMMFIPVGGPSKGVTKLSLEFKSILKASYKTLSNPNALIHIFKAKHKLAPLIKKAGSETNFVKRLYLSLYQSGKLPTSGTFEIVTNIYGYNVTPHFSSKNFTKCSKFRPEAV